MSAGEPDRDSMYSEVFALMSAYVVSTKVEVREFLTTFQGCVNLDLRDQTRARIERNMGVCKKSFVTLYVP